MPSSFQLYQECPGLDPEPGVPEFDVVIDDPQGNVVASFPAQGYWVAWSPDSTRVAVWDEFGPGANTIGIYGIDGTRERQISLPSGSWPADVGELSWMPDGDSLIVDQLEVPLDGGAPRDLPFPFPPLNFMRAVVFSPDETQVAYATRRALMVARPDGSEARELFGDAPDSGAWSQNGERFAITVAAPGDQWPPSQVCIVDVATGSSTLLLEGGEEPIPGISAEDTNILRVIGFSPAGDRILFGSVTISENGDGMVEDSLWSIGVDGSDARQILAGQSEGAWRPV